MTLQRKVLNFGDAREMAQTLTSTSSNFAQSSRTQKMKAKDQPSQQFKNLVPHEERCLPPLGDKRWMQHSSIRAQSAPPPARQYQDSASTKPQSSSYVLSGKKYQKWRGSGRRQNQK
jgi:hypothetical protein